MTLAAPLDRAAGARTRQPENSKRAHLSAPVLQTPPKIPREDPQRDTETAKRWREKEEKARNFGPLHPSGPHPFGAPPFRGPTLSGPHPFGAPPFRGPTLLGPHPSGPTLRGPTLRGPTFSRFGPHPATPTFRGSTLRSWFGQNRPTRVGQSRFGQSRSIFFWPKSVSTNIASCSCWIAKALSSASSRHDHGLTCLLDTFCCPTNDKSRLSSVCAPRVASWCPNEFLLSRLRANRGAHARMFRVCVEKGWGTPPPFPQHTLSSRSLDLSTRGLPADATQPHNVSRCSKKKIHLASNVRQLAQKVPLTPTSSVPRAAPGISIVKPSWQRKGLS